MTEIIKVIGDALIFYQKKGEEGVRHLTVHGAMIEICFDEKRGHFIGDKTNYPTKSQPKQTICGCTCHNKKGGGLIPMKIKLGTEEEALEAISLTIVADDYNSIILQ